ncbi:hypothetical protein [Actinospica robiniae]|uniref:hypothetical protein n=1 Tax=Actinospica robiniae TaxID=304901 RepID=UPI00055150DE|nr:hypothetical protein [Actinospica robiniae]
MTITTATTDTDMAEGSALSKDEDDETYWRSQLFLDASEQDAQPDWYPSLSNVSTGMMYNAVLRAHDPEPAEYVTIPIATTGRTAQDRDLELAVANWNMQWEAAQYRSLMFDEEELPSPVRELAERGEFNVVFVPRTRSRYYEHAPLFHLIPKAMLDRHGLPQIRRGLWPFTMDTAEPDRYLPEDFDVRLSRAWASTVWSHLFRKSPLNRFSDSDPIRLLAHNLDFWLPAGTEVVQDVLRGFGETDHGITAHPVHFTDGTVFDGGVRANPRMGGLLWCGEEEAEQIVRQTIETADTHGRLREILEAVRSNRVEEDFSDRWSYAREDFERKLYHKRLKVKVRFVELTETVPVQGPETEVLGNIVTGDFLAILDERDRQVVVLLHSGVTNLTQVAEVMGYANHSAVSKRLGRIRKQAAEFFDLR